MTQVALTTLSFEQYLHYSDRTDTRYELVRGYLYQTFAISRSNPGISGSQLTNSGLSKISGACSGR